MGKNHPLVKTIIGRKGEKLAHWKIALSYASYLDPVLHDDMLDIYAQVRDTFPLDQKILQFKPACVTLIQKE